MEEIIITDTSEPKKTSGGLIALVALLFLTLGVILGYSLAVFYPQLATNLINKPCTPRPVCLDQEPRCLIPETPDMCPRSVTPTIYIQSKENVFVDPFQNRFRFVYPSDWQEVPVEGPDFPHFVASDGSRLSIQVFDTTFDSLTGFLQDFDKRNQTSWEGRPSRKIISSEKTTIAGLPGVRRIEDWLAADFTTVNTYIYVNNQVYSFFIVPLELPYDQTQAYSAYFDILASFEPISK